MIRRVGILLAVLVSLLIGAVVLAVMVLAWMDLRPRIESYASDTLGRNVSIETLSIGWGSPITLEATGLRLANPAWGSTPDMISIGKLHAEIAVWPLLHGVLDLDRLAVERPVVVLERDADGTGNWAFPALRSRPAGPHAAGPDKLPAHFIAAARLENGDLSFRTSQGHLLRVHVSAAWLQAEGASAPVRLQAEGSYNDLELAIDATLSSFAALRAVPRPVGVDGTVTAKSSTIRFQGTMTDPIGFEGIVGRIETDAALDELSAALGGPGGLDARLVSQGTLSKQAERWRLTQLDATLAETEVTGSAGLDEGKRGQPDHFIADLTTSSLDLQRVLARLQGAATSAGGAGIPLQVEQNPGETFAAKLNAKQVTYGRYALDTLVADIRKEPGRIVLGELSFGLAEGRVQMSGLNETAGKGGHLKLDAALSAGNVGRIMAMTGGDPSMVGGKLDARATLEMTGTTLEDGLAASQGQAVLSMRGGRVSREFLRLASIDLRLLLREGKGNASIVCFLTVANMRNGLLSLAPLRLKTREGNFSGGGEIDLRRAAVDLYLRSDSKSTHFWALDIPLHITGSLTHPKAMPSSGRAVSAQGGRAASNLRLLSPSLRQAVDGNLC